MQMTKARFVISRSKVLEQYRQIRELCDEISFSTKTNPEVAKILEKETDCSFSIHTIEGLEWVDDASRITYLIEGTEFDTLSNLLDKGISNFVIDNQPDLKTFLKTIEERQARVNLFLRMRFQETTIYKGRYFLFGMRADTVNKLIPGLRENPLISRLGIHFHRNTQNTGNWSYMESLKEMLSPETLEAIDVMNIGGGIPVAYRNSNDSNLGYIREKLKELRVWLSSLEIEMIMEPGRPIAAPATRLETVITSISGRHITVNCSVYNTSMDTIIIPHKMLVEGEGSGESYLVKGCTPCSLDIFRYECLLKNPKVGDMLTFLNAGAYNFSSDFCNLRKPETVIEN